MQGARGHIYLRLNWFFGGEYSTDMDWSRLTDFLNSFTTHELLVRLQQWNFWELVQHPWFLFSAGVLSLIALLMRWDLLLLTLLGLTTLSAVAHFDLIDRFELEGLAVNNLFLMLGIGVAFICLIMYLLFTRSDD